MAKIPLNNPVEKAVEGGMIETPHRPYIGYSELGHECNRYLWYCFRWSFKRFITQKQARLFARGKAEEPIIIADLHRARMVVSDEEFEVVDDTGHVKGHGDGKAIKVPGQDLIEKLLLEMKTMNADNFKKYKKKGLKIAFPVYYGQINSYMGKEGLKRCLYVITNKNTDERIYDIIEFDETVYNDLESKGFQILISEEPPEKIGEATWFACKFCNARGVCHKGAPIDRNCRTCERANIENEGKWSCGISGENLPTSFQRKGCRDYKKLSCL